MIDPISAQSDKVIPNCKFAKFMHAEDFGGHETTLLEILRNLRVSVMKFP